METSEQCVIKYRHALRQALHSAGVPSNLAVDDDWILNQVSRLINGKEIDWKKCDHCECMLPGHSSLQIHISVYHPEHANVRWYLGIMG